MGNTSEFLGGMELATILHQAYAENERERLAVVDLRNPVSFVEKRLCGSCNLPLEHLLPRMFLLPDRATPLGLLVAGPPSTQMVQGAATAGGGKQDIQVAAFLQSRGWRVAFCVEASAELWRIADTAGVLETGGNYLSLKRRWPFQPSKLLMEQASLVEELLVQSWWDAGALRGAAEDVTTSPSGTSERGPQAAAGSSPVSTNRSVTLRMLDVGCGSGRDLAWLSTRNSRVSIPRNCHGSRTVDDYTVEGTDVHVAWECVGLDSWHGALQRAAEVLDLGEVAQGAPGGVTLHLVQIGPGNGVIRALPLPSGGNRNSQQHLLRRYLAPEQRLQVEAADNGVDGQGESGASISEYGCDVLPNHSVQGVVPLSALGLFDLVVCVRFLERSFLSSMAFLLKPGGFILFSTFVDGPCLRAFGRPQGREHVLQPHELASSFYGPNQGFQVLRDDMEAIPDGREVTMFCARKL